MYISWNDIKDIKFIKFTSDGSAISLFDDVGDGEAFVEDAEFAEFIFGVTWIKEVTTIK